MADGKAYTWLDRQWWSYLALISRISVSAFCSWLSPVRTPSSCDCTAVFNMASTEPFFLATRLRICSTFSSWSGRCSKTIGINTVDQYTVYHTTVTWKSNLCVMTSFPGLAYKRTWSKFATCLVALALASASMAARSIVPDILLNTQA